MKGKTTLFVVLSILFILFAQGALCDQEWYERPLTPVEGPDEGPRWAGWFYDGEGRWLREAAAPGEGGGARFFADVYGDWYSLGLGSPGVIQPVDPPEWYPWDDTPEKRGLPPKGKDEVLYGEPRYSFRMGEWENYFGAWFRRIDPPGLPPLGVVHLIDSVGGCFVLVVYPGASPRPVERFGWFTGFPPGWGIKPRTTVLVELEQ